MSFDFPNGPTENQEFVPPGSDVRYVYHYPVWIATGGGAAAGTPEAPTDGRQYGRQSSTWTEIVVNPTWATLPGKPATFPPTLPIASSDVGGLDAKQASQDALINAKLDTTSYTAADILNKIKTVDGASSGLDADLLDGQDSSYYRSWSNLTGVPTTFPPTVPIPQSSVANLVTDLAAKEPAVALGTTSLFWRGDKSWQMVPVPNWDTLANKPTTFPPTLPITTGDVTGLDDDQTAQDGAIQSKENAILFGTIAHYWRGDKTWQALDKTAVGLPYVDNTSDAGKPVSDATQMALNLKEDKANKGIANGYAGLDATGKVPAGQLPSYVDDVLEFANLAAFPATGAAGTIYVALDTNRTYRWSGSAYVEISPSPGSTDAVPEGSTNLYFTTARASAAAPVQTVAGRSGAVVLTKTDVGLGNVDNTSDVNKPVSTATQTALNLKLDVANYTAADILNKIKTVDGTTSGLDADVLDGQDSAYYLALANATGTLPGARFDDTSHGNRGGGSLHAVVTTSVNGFMLATDKVKLDGIQAGATDDQTAAEILTAIKTVDGSASGLDADVLDGQDGAYYLAWNNFTGKPVSFPPSFHTHPESEVTGLIADLAAKEPTIAAGSTSQYWRGDKSWQTLPPPGIYDAPVNSKIYARQNATWYELPAAGGTSATTIISDTAPASPTLGTLWWESDTGKMFIWYDDGNSAQWVPAHVGTGPQGPKGDAGPQGSTGPVGPGGGDMLGAASSTDNMVPRYSGTTGKLIKGSTLSLNDTGYMFDLKISGQSCMAFTQSQNGTFTLTAQPPHGQTISISPRSDVIGSPVFTGGGQYTFDNSISIGQNSVSATVGMQCQSSGSKRALSITTGVLNLPHGAAPSAPVDGDIWTTTNGPQTRVNGTEHNMAWIQMTQAAYDALSVKKTNVMYVIVG